MSAIVRGILGLALLGFTSCATPWDSGYRPSASDTRDIIAAVIRFRLTTNPLPHHRELNIFADGGDVPGLFARLPEYHVKLRSGSGASPMRARWYWLHMGRFTPGKAFVLVSGSGTRMKVLELRRRDQQWIVVQEDEPVLI